MLFPLAYGYVMTWYLYLLCVYDEMIFNHLGIKYQQQKISWSELKNNLPICFSLSENLYLNKKNGPQKQPIK